MIVLLYTIYFGRTPLNFMCSPIFMQDFFCENKNPHQVRRCNTVYRKGIFPSRTSIGSTKYGQSRSEVRVELSTHISAKRLLDIFHLEVSGMLLAKINRCCWVYGCTWCIAVSLLAVICATPLGSRSNLAACQARHLQARRFIHVDPTWSPERMCRGES